MLDFYANQTLSWAHTTALNEYNEPTRTTTNIKGRKEPINKLVRNAQGEEVVVATRIFTETAITVNDTIDGDIVISSSPQPNLDGSIAFYEIYCL